MNVNDELKKLEQEAKRLAKRKQALEAKAKAQKDADQKVEKLIKESGYKTPRSLIKAIMQKSGIRSVTLSKSASSTASPSTKAFSGKKRSRVTVTSKLRDDIKKALETDTTYTDIAEKFGVSYPVVKKIEAGGYDKL